ncbi:hypothetical protein [Desulfovibrio sp. JC010]|uniref:hypothetical protein n=1 Tax=Desulfovibrio sp. JC010 TaxID=2593641 RepID=UPI0013D87B20|nr:hypothetical protein [Desulfovibrio sp. JC010]NDV27544.1 hypothetical protein [Desulfovibrio sp. JC010]
MKFKFMLLFVSVLVLGLLPAVGYGSDADKLVRTMADKGIQPLTKLEIVTLLKDKTMEESLAKYHYMMYQAPDGTLKGKAWGDWGEELDTGIWYVTDEGLYCSEWSGMWAKNGKQCSALYPSKNGDGYVRVIVKGKRTKAHPSGVYRPQLVSGDQI